MNGAGVQESAMKRRSRCHASGEAAWGVGAGRRAPRASRGGPGKGLPFLFSGIELRDVVRERVAGVIEEGKAGEDVGLENGEEGARVRSEGEASFWED